MVELQFKGGNPGAVQYGNFINYYKFHPPEERIKLLPQNMWGVVEPYVILDIGCNAGDLTVAVKKFMDQNLNVITQVLAVDIDSILIKRAQDAYARDSIIFKCVDIMNKKHRTNIIQPYLETRSIKMFSITFCFSITMWIHLNHGDDGLKDFFHYISSISKILVVEPQPWKCYKSAVKRMKQQNVIFPYFQKLKIQRDVEKLIEEYLLTHCGLIKITESDRTTWNRKLLIFKQNVSN